MRSGVCPLPGRSLACRGRFGQGNVTTARPACLRLAVTLTPVERDAIRTRVFLDDALAAELDAWIRKHYRDRLAPEDLGDPALVDETRRALDEMTHILHLPAVYPFQGA